MVIGILGLLWTRSLFSKSLVAIVPQVLAVMLGAWARVTFGRRSFHLAANPTSGGLATAGPYRVIRHPIYTAACLLVLPAALGSWKATLLVGVVVGGALVRVFCEESLLPAEYPEYQSYAARTWRMVPFVF